MHRRHAILAAALATLSAAPTGAAHASAAATDQCYGIAKAGQNDCANTVHDCARLSTKDYDGREWVTVKVGTCLAMGGKMTAFSGVGKVKK